MKKNTSMVTLNTSSWANKHGISKQNNGSPLFGLNPNLNIEDEYIENLLKQTHFLNMEIKLLKEKQQQSEGNSLWGIINRSNEPLVKNIVDSNQKYQTMKKQVDTDLNKTQYENIRLADQQNAIIKKMNHLEKKIGHLNSTKNQMGVTAKTKRDCIDEKIAEYEAKLKHLQSQKEQELKRNADLVEQYESILLDVQKDKFKNNYEVTKIKNDEDIEIILEAERLKEIENLKSKIESLKLSIENSHQYQRAREDQAVIKQNMSNVCKNISIAEFELLQITESIKLAEKEKEKEVLERKKLMQEYETLKVILKEIQTLNESRLNQQVQNRKRESVEIQKGEYQTKKLEKNLDQIKKKLARSEESEKGLRQQVEHMERDLIKIKDKRDELNKTLQRMTASNDQQDTILSNCRNEFKRVQDQYEKIAHSELTSSCQLNEIETEVIYLRQRKEFLSEALNLKETLSQTKLEDLQKVVQKNKDVNQTVSLLMEKWEEIKNFSKM